MFEWDESRIDSLVSYLMGRESTKDIHDAIDSLHKKLMAIDWESAIEAKRSKLEFILNELVPCERCHKEVARRNLGWLINGWAVSAYASHCSDCLKIAYEEAHSFCIICDQRFRSNTGSHHFCRTCKTDALLREAIRVSSHNSRANLLNVPATLTVKQWILTLKFFNWKCAYCQGSFQALEHYIPLPQEGTTQENCFPSCHKCNHVKKDKLPEQFERLFPTANIQRIKEYQAAI